MDVLEWAKNFVLWVGGFFGLAALTFSIGRQYREKADKGLDDLLAEFSTTSTMTGFVQTMLLAAILWRVW